jgi:hypothetical protein
VTTLPALEVRMRTAPVAAPRAVPRNCAFYNPQAACWGAYRPAVARLLGLPSTRPDPALLAAAVRRWQYRQGLAADGVLGPRTWERIWTTLGVHPVPSVSIQLPPEGPGFVAYAVRRPHHRFGCPETVRALQHVAARWRSAHPAGPRIGVGDLSLRGGGPIWGHCSHQCGIDVDLRPLRRDGIEGGVRWDSPAYSAELTGELVGLLHRNDVLPVEFVLFNDRDLPGVRPYRNHDDHLHVRFRPPAGTDPEQALAEGPPPHLAMARSVWTALGLPTGVTIRDAGDLPNWAVRDFLLQQGLAAWTNSAKEVFVNPSLADRATAMVALHHEAEHIRQFRVKGGPPPSYAHMMRYECDAYRLSAMWTSSHTDPDVRALAADMQKHADRLCDEIAAAKNAHLSWSALNTRYRKFLIGNQYLPAREFLDVRDLYRRWRPPRRRP